MNPFLTLRVNALHGSLSPLASPHAAYLASDAFVKRTSLEGDEAQADRLAIVHFMLQTVALDPREGASAIGTLKEKGWVQPQFFGVATPVPLFSVAVGSSEQAALLKAYQENLDGPMNDAARRVLKWREPRRVNARESRSDAILDRLRASLDWPDSKSMREDPTRSLWKNKDNILLIDEKRSDLRQQRLRRLSVLADAAAPGLRSWSEYLERIAVVALLGEPDLNDKPRASARTRLSA